MGDLLERKTPGWIRTLGLSLLRLGQRRAWLVITRGKGHQADKNSRVKSAQAWAAQDWVTSRLGRRYLYWLITNFGWASSNIKRT